MVKDASLVYILCRSNEDMDSQIHYELDDLIELLSLSLALQGSKAIGSATQTSSLSEAIRSIVFFPLLQILPIY